MRESRRAFAPLAVCAAAYLYGSLPFVYLLGRRRNVDLRAFGSGNVGATNLLAAGGRWRAALGWALDASKGLLPPLLARRLGYPAAVAALAAGSGVAGQCWPLFLRFQGGRGISAFVGAALALNRRAWLAAIAPMIGGGLWRVVPRLVRARTARPLAAARSRSVPLGCFIATLAYGLVYSVQSSPGGARGARLASLAPALLPAGVVLARRLTAPQPDDALAGPAIRRVALAYRLLYDRNTSR